MTLLILFYFMFKILPEMRNVQEKFHAQGYFPEPILAHLYAFLTFFS